MGVKVGWSTARFFDSRQPLTPISCGIPSSPACKPQQSYVNVPLVKARFSHYVKNATIQQHSVPWVSYNRQQPADHPIMVEPLWQLGALIGFVRHGMMVPACIQERAIFAMYAPNATGHHTWQKTVNRNPGAALAPHTWF